MTDSAARKLTRCRGSIDLPIHKLISKLCPTAPPCQVAPLSSLLWREPVPTAQRIGKESQIAFIGLGTPQQLNYPEEPLDEARLFWTNDDQSPAGAIHLLSNNYGSATCGTTRWSAFWETADGDPGWISSLLTSDVHRESIGRDGIQSVEESVFTLQDSDLNRYGLLNPLHQSAMPKQLKIISHWKNGQCLCWRLA